MSRLFKLLDRYKTGKIKLSDLQIILPKKKRSKTSTPVHTHIEQNKDPSFIRENPFLDWKHNAKQQIGLYLNLHYKDLAAAFDLITKHSVKLVYQVFKKWIEQNDILKGFSLTEALLLQLFGSLDPHKKGYLTISDWNNAFKGYDSIQ